MNKKLLWWIFAVTRGGVVRAEIIKRLRERPSTTSQLAREMGLTYQDIRYHLRILKEHNLVESSNTSIAIYFVTEEMERNWGEFTRILKAIEGRDAK